MAERANVTFIDRGCGRNVQLDVAVATGASGWDQRLTIACHDHAADYGYTHWVQPYRVNAPPTEEWLVFTLDRAARSRGARQFLKRFPTREAAEVWALSHG